MMPEAGDSVVQVAEDSGNRVRGRDGRCLGHTILSRVIQGEKGTTHANIRLVSAHSRPSESLPSSARVHSRPTTACGCCSDGEALARQIVLSAAEIG
jgi:hypothetical protein